MSALDEIIARIPELDGLAAADYDVARLPGHTNETYRLRRAGEDWILRVPRAATDAPIDRDAERHNQAIAAELGLAPAVCWRDAAGVTLTPTLPGTRYLRPRDLADKALRERVVDLLRRLHRSGRRFRGSVDLGALLQDYRELLPAATLERFAPRFEQSQWVIGRLETVDAEPVPSHNDLVLENLLLERSRIWLIDWEYSAPASPYWDLATLANAADLDYRQSRDLLQAYAAGGAPLDESVLFDYRGLLRLLADCWMAVYARDDGDADA